MGQGKKHKSKSGKPHETARREEPETARAGKGDEPSTSQEPGENSGDEDTATPKLSNRSQIDRISGSQSSSANIHVFTTCPILTTRTRRRAIS